MVVVTTYKISFSKKSYSHAKFIQCSELDVFLTSKFAMPVYGNGLYTKNKNMLNCAKIMG